MATAFPNALRISAGGPVGNTTGQPQPWAQQDPDGGGYAYNDPYQAQIDYLQQRAAAPAQPTYNPDQIKQRKDDNANQYALGLLGTLSGNQGMSDVGGQVLKQALANRQVKYTDHGTYDPLSGEFNYSPDYLQERDATMLNGAYQRQAQGRLAWQETQSRNQQRAEAAQQHSQMMIALKGMGSGGQNAGGNFHPWGYMPDGSQVVTNTKDGMQYNVKPGADGRPVYTPVQADAGATPASAWEKNVSDVGSNVATAGRIDQMLQVMKDNPHAFGPAGSFVSAMPAWAQGQAARSAGLTSDDLAARAALMRQASIELNHLYGAAVSNHEEARANTFLPNQNDPPEVIQAKLKAARDWAYEYAGQHGQGSYGAAVNRGAGSANLGGVPASVGKPGPQRNPHDPYNLLGGQ